MALQRKDIELKVWVKAITEMPQVTKHEWDHFDVVTKWLIASRAAVLLMTLMSCVIAGLFAFHHDSFNALRFGLLCIGLMLAHAANNIFNDVSDHQRGVDQDNAFRTRYGTQPVEQGLMSVREAKRMGWMTLAVGLACGVTLALMVGLQVLPFVVIGVLLVFGYNWPLKHYGLGEPVVVLVWGPLMVGGGYLSLTGMWSWDVALVSIPYALGPTTVLFGKHTDKIPWDAPKGVRTFPVLLGSKASRVLTILLMLSQYGMTIGLIVFEVLHPGMLIVAFAVFFLPQVVAVYKEEPPESPPAAFPDHVWPLWYSAYAFVHFRRFGLLYLAGLALHLAMSS